LPTFRSLYNTDWILYYDGTQWHIANETVRNEWSNNLSEPQDPDMPQGAGVYQGYTGDLNDCSSDFASVSTGSEATTTPPVTDFAYTNYLLSIIASSTATTTNVMYGDWLIMNLWILFFLSLIGLGFFFQLFRKRTGYDRALK